MAERERALLRSSGAGERPAQCKLDIRAQRCALLTEDPRGFNVLPRGKQRVPIQHGSIAPEKRIRLLGREVLQSCDCLRPVRGGVVRFAKVEADVIVQLFCVFLRA